MRLLLPRLILARTMIDDGSADAASRSIEQLIGSVRDELGEEHPMIATAHVWRSLALDRQGDCAGALRERAAAEAADARKSNPWFAEARAAVRRKRRVARDDR